MMRKLFLFVAACLVACVTQTAKAYEYTLDIAGMGQNMYTASQIPESGVTIYIHANNGAPNIYAWNSNGELNGGWPGQKMTDLKAVNVIGDGDNKKSYYRINFPNEENVNFIVNYGGDDTKSTDTHLTGTGSYFFDFNGRGGTTLIADNKYFASSSSSSQSNNINLYVRVLGENMVQLNDVPYAYFWTGDSGDPDQQYSPWGQSWAHQAFTQKTTINDLEWWTMSIDKSKVADNWDGSKKGGLKLSLLNNGNYTNETKRIENLIPGDYYIFYHPYGEDGTNKYEFTGMATGGHTNNYEEWTYNCPFIIDNNKVTFTATGEHGTVDLTLVCASADDADKVAFKNGELRFPKGTSLRVESNDGTNLREVWLGRPQQGENSYRFTVEGNSEFHSATNQAGTYNVHDMDNTAYWQYDGNDQLYLVYGSKTLSTQAVSNSGANEFYISSLVRIYTEGISLEDLTYSDHNVKEQNHAFDHDLVGYQVVEFAGEGKALLARSVNPISAAHKRVNNGQQLWYNEDGSLEEYANPATDQYAWIALFFEDGVDPAQYVKKQISGVRGMYCNPKTGRAADYHIHWCNPVMAVDASSLKVVNENVETKINTYCPANLSEQKDKKYFMIEPRPFEPCNLVDVMRMGTGNIGGADGDGVFTPTNEALLPNGATNKYTVNGVEGGGALLGPSDNLGDHKHIWTEVDKKYGADWKTFGKVFNVTDAIIVISDRGTGELDEKEYNFPLPIPNGANESEIRTKKLHFSVFGTANSNVKLEDYPDEDMAVAESDFFSRYDFENDQNVYKNDLLVMLNNVDPESQYASDPFNGIENLEVYRYDQTGQTKLATVATLEHQGNGKFKVKYNTESQNARGNARLMKDGSYLGDNHFLDESTVYDLTSTNPVIYFSDIFIGDKMADVNIANSDNTDVRTSYLYRLKNTPKNTSTSQDQVRDVTCVIKKIPAFIPFNYILTRASYDEEEVNNDVNGILNPKVDFVEAQFDVIRGYQVDGWSVMRDEENTFMASVSENRIDHTTLETQRLSLTEDENKSKPEESAYVPVLMTDYNDNTYGCFKQTVKDTEVYLSCLRALASKATSAEGEKYFNAQLSIISNIIDPTDENGNPVNFTSNDSRWLFRVWRQVEGKEPVLLNTLSNFPLESLAESEGWYTNYNILPSLNEDSENVGAFTISDTFIAKVGAPQSNAPALMATGDDNLLSVDYKVYLYVEDKNTGKFYVRTSTQHVDWDSSVATGITGIDASAQVESVRYYNTIGVESETPFQGLNIVVTRYSDGTTTTVKAVR